MGADVSRAGVAILGLGAVGRAFADHLLDRSNCPFRGPLTLWSRSRTSAAAFVEERTRTERGRLRLASEIESAVVGQAVVLVCVSEDALPAVARALVRRPPPGRVRPAVLITSGSFALARLASLRRAGYALGRLHPLAPFRREFSGADLYCSPLAVEGDARALRAAATVARWTNGERLPLSARPGAAQAYHAGAALLGGGLVALLALAERSMAPSLRVEPIRLRKALQSFVSHVARRTWLDGPREALTGPLARGAEGVVRAHLRALRGVPRAAGAYRELGQTMLELARARGSIDAATERRLRRLLRSTKR